MIVNNFTHPVVLADKRDPQTSWINHRARGSSGGVDLAYPEGTKIKSPADGVFTYKTGGGTGGNIGAIHLDNGDRIELLHLSAPLIDSGTRVSVGTDIARSGRSGTPAGGGSYAAHLHVHYVTKAGVRLNLWDKFTPPKPTPKPVYGIPRTSTAEDGIPGTVFYKRLQLWGKMFGKYTGPLDGKPGVETWKAIQRYLSAKFEYDGPIDGKPGNYTYAALQRLAARYGYRGRIDGVPGKETWKGVAKALNRI